VKARSDGKAKANESVDAIGRGEAMAAHVVATLVKARDSSIRLIAEGLAVVVRASMNLDPYGFNCATDVLDLITLVQIRI
jgi:hypothetical protein